MGKYSTKVPKSLERGEHFLLRAKSNSDFSCRVLNFYQMTNEHGMLKELLNYLGILLIYMKEKANPEGLGTERT